MMPVDYEYNARRGYKLLIISVLCGVVGVMAIGGCVDSETGEIQSWFAAITGLILLIASLVFLIMGAASCVKAFKAGRRALKEQKHDYSKDL